MYCVQLFKAWPKFFILFCVGFLSVWVQYLVGQIFFSINSMSYQKPKRCFLDLNPKLLFYTLNTKSCQCPFREV